MQSVKINCLSIFFATSLTAWSVPWWSTYAHYEDEEQRGTAIHKILLSVLEGCDSRLSLVPILCVNCVFRLHQLACYLLPGRPPLLHVRAFLGVALRQQKPSGLGAIGIRSPGWPPHRSRALCSPCRHRPIYVSPFCMDQRIYVV